MQARGPGEPPDCPHDLRVVLNRRCPVHAPLLLSGILDIGRGGVGRQEDDERPPGHEGHGAECGPRGCDEGHSPSEEVHSCREQEIGDSNCEECTTRGWQCTWTALHEACSLPAVAYKLQQMQRTSGYEAYMVQELNAPLASIAESSTTWSIQNSLLTMSSKLKPGILFS